MLTTEDVAEFFRMDVVTVRRMISKGELTAYRIGGEYRLARSDIEEYLERQRLPAGCGGNGHLGKLPRRARKLGHSGSLVDTLARSTKRAQSALALAQEEARSLDHNCIGTEHLLLGIVREGEGIGARLLGEYGCDLDTMRRTVWDTVGSSPSSRTAHEEMPTTPRLKKVLQLAQVEASQLGHAYVGTEHLVLGLLAEGEGVAGRLLRGLGIELKAARSQVMEIIAQQVKG